MSKLKIKNRYGITPNHILNDKNLSMKAKGLFGYIQSKPEDWDFSVQRIELQTKDGRDSISAGLKELEDIGYLKRVKYKDGEGKWDWEYHLTDIPFTENPSTVFPFTGNPQIYSNKELVIKNSKKELHNDFSLFWKEYPKKIGKGAAEKAWKKMKPPIEDVLDAIRVQRQTDQWLKNKGQFIPNPATWLNQKRWEDEVEVTINPKFAKYDK